MLFCGYMKIMNKVNNTCARFWVKNTNDYQVLKFKKVKNVWYY